MPEPGDAGGVQQHPGSACRGNFMVRLPGKAKRHDGLVRNYKHGNKIPISHPIN